MIRFTHLDGSQSYSALHCIRKIFYNENEILTARTDRADGYWEDFEIRCFELLEWGRIYS